MTLIENCRLEAVFGGDTSITKVIGKHAAVGQTAVPTGPPKRTVVQETSAAAPSDR
jgi:hypothetical protein